MKKLLKYLLGDQHMCLINEKLFAMNEYIQIIPIGLTKQKTKFSYLTIINGKVKGFNFFTHWWKVRRKNLFLFS